MAERKPGVLDQSPAEVTLNYLVILALIVIVYMFAWIFGRNWMVLHFSDLWKSGVNTPEAFGRVWFIFVWAFGFTFVAGALSVIRREPQDRDPLVVLGRGQWLSWNAGFFEELIFRCFAFLSSMVFLRLLNAITYGFVSWFYSQFMIPLANWATFGALELQLKQSGWLLAAAIISTNGEFRDAHKYNGLVGYINSWFLGMVFYWLVFNYGLMTAIWVHIAYDAIIFATVAATTALQPRPQYTLRW